MAWTDDTTLNNEFNEGQIAKSSSMQQLNANVRAVMEGADNAPRLAIRGIDTDVLMTLNSMQQPHVHASAVDPSRIFYSQRDTSSNIRNGQYKSPFAFGDYGQIIDFHTLADPLTVAGAESEQPTFFIYNYTDKALNYQLDFEIYTRTDDVSAYRVLANGVEIIQENLPTAVQPPAVQTFQRGVSIDIPANSPMEVRLQLRLQDGGGSPDDMGVRGVTGVLTQPLVDA